MTIHLVISDTMTPLCSTLNLSILALCPCHVCTYTVGYTIFVVEGDLPQCEADDLLSLVPIEPQKQSPTSKLPPTSRRGGFGGHHSKSSAAPSKTHEGVVRSGRGHRGDDEDSYALDLAKALSVSMAGEVKDQQSLDEDEQFDISMASALSESLQGEITTTCTLYNCTCTSNVESSRTLLILENYVLLPPLSPPPHPSPILFCVSFNTRQSILNKIAFCFVLCHSWLCVLSVHCALGDDPSC